MTDTITKTKVRADVGSMTDESSALDGLTDDNETDESPDDITALGMPDEEQESIIQLTELAEKTVKPGVMKLRINEVADAHNSPQTILQVTHPVEGDIKFSFNKMSDDMTWDRGSELKRVLDWYGYTKRDMHALKQEQLYIKSVRSRDDADSLDGEWKVVAPPSDFKKKLKRYKSAFGNWMKEKIPPLGIRAGIFANHVIGNLFRKLKWTVPTGSHAALGVVITLFAFTGMAGTLMWLGLSAIATFASVALATLVSALIGAAVGILIIAPPGGR